NIPPHNLSELCDALIDLSRHKDLEVKDLLKHIKGPDFPTGGQILNSKSELRQIYETGQGSVRVRGEWKLEELPRGGRQVVVTRRFEFDLKQVQQRLHILEGFAKVYDALDEMLKMIRKSEGKEDAAKKLIKRFKLSEEQADAILEMKLYRLARLEILVIQKELKEKRAEQRRLKELLGNERSRWAVVRDEIAEIQKAYADKRRTKIGG